MSEKNTQSAHENTDLKSQITKLESNLKGRDSVFEKWNLAIGEIDIIISKNQDELIGLKNEKNICGGLAGELGKMMRGKFEVGGGGEEFFGRSSNRLRRELMDDFDRGLGGFGGGSLAGMLGV